jgi:dTDP-4-dehydrorhamnose 3,5-epimerase
MIKGVHVKKLKVIKDERGLLMEMMRSDDSFFTRFGQVYTSVCNPGFVKGWHWHKVQTDNFVVVHGMGHVSLYDRRKDSPTYGELQDFEMGEDNPILVSIPPGVLHGIECIGDRPCYLVNCPTETYDYDQPDEFRVDPFSREVPNTWKAKKGH